MDFFSFNHDELSAIFLSLKVATICSVISLPLALAVGWILARKDFKGKLILDGFVQLPLVLPPVTTGFLLLIVFGTNGLIGKWLFQQFGLRISFSFWAAVMAAVIVSFPLVVRAIRVAFEMVDAGLESAALTLGSSPLKAFFTVTLPIALPGIISGFILCFARSLGEFGATITFAGNIVGKTQTMPLMIYSAMEMPGREMDAFRLVLASVILSFLAMASSELMNRKVRKRRR